MTIRWFKTDLPFLEGEQVINARIWDSEIVDDLEVGEDTRDKPHPYRGGQVAGLLGDHVCGPEEWFRNGQPWPTDIDPVEYDADGIPTCCPRGTVGFVGYAAKPEALVSYDPPFAPSFSCFSAPTPAYGTTYNLTAPPVQFPFGINNVYWVDIPNAGSGCYITLTGIVAGLEVVALGGLNCFGLSPIFGPLPNGTFLITVGFPFGRFTVKATTPGAVSAPFTLKVDPFP